MAKCVRCGKKHPFLKVDSNHICLNCYTEELKYIKTKIPELNASVSELNSRIHLLERQLQSQRLGILNVEESNQLETASKGLSCMYDPRLKEAVEIVYAAGQASVSMLHRRMHIGYARAGRLIDEMEMLSIISKADDARPRNVLITRAQLDRLL